MIYEERHEDVYETIVWYMMFIMDGPNPTVFIARQGKTYYWTKTGDVSDIVEKWLNEHGYEWGSMSEQEEWELELFMRSL